MAAVIPFIPMIASAVGGLMSSSASAGAASSAGESQAAAMNYNAAIARNNAIAAQQAAAANAKQQDRINLAREGKLEAGILHNGVLMEGTPLMLMEDQAAQGELDKQKIIYNGQVQANNYNNQAQLDEFNATQARSAGSNKSSGIMQSGMFDLAGTVGKSLFKN